jgi:hypothetical protein
VHELLNVDLLSEHLRSEVTLGTYLLDQESRARLIVLDADDEQACERLGHLARTLADEAVPTYLEKSRYVDLKPTASSATGLCPFHDDHHPSLEVSDEGNYWNCFAGCGGGSVIDFWTEWKRSNHQIPKKQTRLPKSDCHNRTGFLACMPAVYPQAPP